MNQLKDKNNKGILQCSECKKWVNFRIHGKCQACTRSVEGVIGEDEKHLSTDLRDEFVEIDGRNRLRKEQRLRSLCLFGNE